MPQESMSGVDLVKDAGPRSENGNRSHFSRGLVPVRHVFRGVHWGESRHSKHRDCGGVFTLAWFCVFRSVPFWQWDYKTRIQNQNELLAQLRAMLNTMLQQKQRFKDACIDTEAALKVTCVTPPRVIGYKGKHV